MVEICEQRAELAQRLEHICAELHALGKVPWSRRVQCLDRWMDLDHERNQLQQLLAHDTVDGRAVGNASS
jgi:hypothetical protein